MVLVLLLSLMLFLLLLLLFTKIPNQIIKTEHINIFILLKNIQLFLNKNLDNQLIIFFSKLDWVVFYKTNRFFKSDLVLLYFLFFF